VIALAGVLLGRAAARCSFCPLSTVAVETLGTRLVLPFGFIDLNEVRGFRIEAADSLLAVPAIVGVAVVGPAGGSSTGSGHDTSSSPAS